MKPRLIRPPDAPILCTICARSLLRGEHPVAFLAAGEPREVCELCTDRARQQGWVRADSQVDGQQPTGRGDKRYLPGRFRVRKGGSEPVATEVEPVVEFDHFADVGESIDLEPHRLSDEVRAEEALSIFNASDQPPSIASVTASLGAPTVVVHPFQQESQTVEVVVAWELCWYRYEIALSDIETPITMTAKGHNLDELASADKVPNAEAHADGHLAMVTLPR